MKKFYPLSLICLLASSFGMDARQLTSAEAYDAAMRTMGVRLPLGAGHGEAPDPVYTAKDRNLNTLYVFNNGGDGGFIVVSADDVAVPLLGYSDSGDFDPGNIPPQMQWWLEQYSAEIAAASASGMQSVMMTRNASTRPEVNPILQTQWNQDAPYNNDCPEVTYNSNTGRAVTGCVATAMAQVMKVYDWPAKGVGSNSYSWYYGGSNYQQSMDFSSVTFDWNDMLDDYDAGSTAEQDAAVALLMHACGVSCNMNYGLASTGGSGSSSVLAAKALLNYFDYDKGVSYRERQYYSYEEWVEMIYEELASGRPVLLGGQNEEGGHEFVCDGYSDDDYFHINWGWSGMSDGYFLLSALTPPSQGIGGSMAGYDMNQNAIIGIQPPVAGSELSPVMVFDGDFGTAAESYSRTDNITFGGDNSTMIHNMSLGSITVTLGVKTEDSDGVINYIPSRTYAGVNLPTGSGWYGYTIPGSSFAAGVYKVTPACLVNGVWYDVKVNIDNVQYTVATVTSSSITFSEEMITPVQVKDITLNTPVYVGENASFDVTFESITPFYAEIMPVLYDGDTPVATCSGQGVTLEPDQPQTYNWVTSFKPVTSGETLAPGTYTLRFCKVVDYLVSNPFDGGVEVTVNAAQTVTPRAQLASVVFNGCPGEGTSADPYVIDPMDLDITITIDGTAGYWSDNVMALFYDPSTGNSVGSAGTVFMGVEDGKSVSATFKTPIYDLEEGATYWMLPYGVSHGQMGRIMYVRVDNESSVESVEAHACPVIRYDAALGCVVIDGVGGVADVSVYSMLGTRVATARIDCSGTVDTGMLANGGYIVTLAGENVSATAKLLVR